MSGELTYKNTNKKEEWIVQRTTNQPKVRTDESLYPNTVRNIDGTLRPAIGYEWVSPQDPNDFRVTLMPGLIKAGEGFRSAAGYDWVNTKDPNDVRVKRIP